MIEVKLIGWLLVVIGTITIIKGLRDRIKRKEGKWFEFEWCLAVLLLMTCGLATVYGLMTDQWPVYTISLIGLAVWLIYVATD